MSTRGNNIFVGKDILRLLTTAMYNNPLVVYREYIQNSVDAIESAVNEGFDKNQAAISVDINHQERSVVIRDNGAGISRRKFRKRMTSLGWSDKKGTSLRGLWGIGRLVGLSYCRTLTFRTKAAEEDAVSCVTWDGVEFKKLLSEGSEADLASSMERILEIKSEPVNRKEPAFFEVRMTGVIRHGNDALLNAKLVTEYLSQIAPVPFHPDAPSVGKIADFLRGHVDISGYRILVNNASEPVYRPHRKEFLVSPSQRDRFRGVHCFKIGSAKTVAAGWVLQHSYLGALKGSPALRGFRARVGNMQIGDERIFTKKIFQEERFNGWTVGELHIVDPKILPNSQRSDFEDTPLFRDVVSQLVPLVGRAMTQNCRASSVKRNQKRTFEKHVEQVNISLGILEKNFLSPQKRDAVLKQLEDELVKLRSNHPDASNVLNPVFDRLRKLRKSRRKAPLTKLPQTQQRLVQNISDLIYATLPDASAAEDLLTRITSSLKKPRP